MAEISLRAYEQDIQDMIDHGHFDEAVAHCQNILGRFPKHAETYRLLGKAYLEQGRHAEAADVFQRVLSAIPDDFLSHVAMAIMGEDAGNLDTAIWHMERAFEVNPSNPTVQQEVRRLRGRRDGVEPSRLRMTRASLARMYLKGGLDAQAAAEVSSALQEDPERPDLQVVLANAYWKMGKLAEGAELCNRLLEKLPYCLEANQILARILWKTGRKQEAQDVFRRLAALDPYVGVKPPTDDGRMPEVPASAVTVDRLSWTPPTQEPKGPPPGWAEGLGLKKEEGAEVKIPEWLEPNKAPPVEPSPPFGAEAEESPFHPPDWLGEAAAQVPGAEGIQAEGLVGAGEPEAALARMGQEVPDWLKPGGGPPETAAPPPSPANWLQPEKPKKEEPTGDFAEWLKAVGGEESLIRAAEGLPEWLKPEEQSAQPAEPAAALPEWLKGEAPEPAQEAEEYPEISSGQPSGEGPPLGARADWLAQGGPGQVVSPFDLAGAGSAVSQEKIPDWLEAELREAPGISSSEAPPSAPAEAAAGPPEAPAPSGPTPPWLEGIAKEVALPPEAGQPFVGPTAAPLEEVAPALPATELPDWLRGEVSPAPSASSESALPDWLRAETSKGQEKAPEAAEQIEPKGVTGPPEEPTKEKGVEIPEWMAAAQSPVPPSSSTEGEKPAPAGEVPDWLKRIAAEASGVPEEAAPPEPEMATGELPSWLDAKQPGASDTISKWLGERLGPRPRTEEKPQPKPEAEELPEWLRLPGEAEAKPAAVEEEEAVPPSQEMPAAPETPATIEKAGEQAPPEWLRTALGLRDTEISSVLPKAEAQPSPAEVPATELPPAPIPAPMEARQAKPGTAPVSHRPAAGPGRGREAVPPPEERAIPSPAPSAFLPGEGEELPAMAAERGEWVPFEEPVAVPTREQAAPQPKEPARPVSAPVHPPPRKKSRKLTKEEATSMIAEGRRYLEDGREQDAVAAYQKILESGRLADQVADDLDKAVNDYPSSSGLWQLLGDASSRLGRLQRAYEAYAKALEKI